MCVLTGPEIRNRINAGSLVVRPFTEDLIQPASLDLRVSGDYVLFPKDSTGESYEYRVWGKEKIIIYPPTFLLASTLEWVEIPEDLVARVEGRSSYARLGLFVHTSAGYIDPGFKGNITLELYHVGAQPITLHKGDAICQLVLYSTLGDTQSYQGSYQMSSGPITSKL
jgi:dCTP deaminase